MTALLLLLFFLVFAALMFARVMPALLAVPAMALCIGFIVRLPLTQILNDIVAAGAVKLAPAYVAVFAGAMLGRVMLHSGIAEEIIKRAAEFGGERPMIVAAGLMAVTAVLFTSLTGLGAIIMVGSLVLPIMMSLGIPRKLAGVLFLLAFATGFIFNIALWRLYREVLQIAPESALPPQVPHYAVGLLLIMTAAVAGYVIFFSRKRMEFWALATPADFLDPAKRRVPAISFLTPFIPLVLYVGFGWRELPAFLGGALFAIVTTAPRRGISTLTSALVRGIEDGAPAGILLMGIGMLLNALTLPAVKTALVPWITAVPLHSPVTYVLFFGLLSPLALYRGPFNPFGLGIGLYSIMFTARVLPALALLAVMMSIVQVQNVCDPTNTHNVWVANFVGIPVEEITRSTILLMMAVCFCGLLLGAVMFLR